MEVVMFPNPLSSVLWFSPFGLWMMSFEAWARITTSNRQFMGQMKHSELLTQDAQQRLTYLFSG